MDRSGIREAAARLAGDSARYELNLRQGKTSGELSRIPRRGAPWTVPGAGRRRGARGWGWAGTTFDSREDRRRPTRAISCRTAFGTGRGADVDGPELHGWEETASGSEHSSTTGTDDHGSGR